MYKYSRLRYIGLFQLFFGAGEHDVCDTETQYIIGLLKKVFGCAALLVKVLAHAAKLRALARKNICVLHVFVVIVPLK